MKVQNKTYYIFNYFFLFGMMILFLNDQIFKWEFGNWFTGKLSDVVGVFVLPFLLSYFFPKHIKRNIIITTLFFIFWKSPLSEVFIQSYNKITFLPINRVVDYTDLLALAVLPLSYYCLRRVERFSLRLKIHPIIIVLPACLIMLATSRPRDYYYNRSTGNVILAEEISIKNKPSFILSKFKENGIEVRLDRALISEIYSINPKDIDSSSSEEYYFYKAAPFVVNNDTIKNLQFAIDSVSEELSTLYLNSITLDKNLDDETVKERLENYYGKAIRIYFDQLFDF